MTFRDQDSDRKELRDVVIPLWQLEAMKTGLIRSCVNCINFDLKAEGCNLANGQRPPATVIALSCPKWDWDIPF